MNKVLVKKRKDPGLNLTLVMEVHRVTLGHTLALSSTHLTKLL